MNYDNNRYDMAHNILVIHDFMAPGSLKSSDKCLISLIFCPICDCPIYLMQRDGFSKPFSIKSKGYCENILIINQNVNKMQIPINIFGDFGC